MTRPNSSTSTDCGNYRARLVQAQYPMDRTRMSANHPITICIGPFAPLINDFLCSRTSIRFF